MLNPCNSCEDSPGCFSGSSCGDLQMYKVYLEQLKDDELTFKEQDQKAESDG